jgi:hypothetical protein
MAEDLLLQTIQNKVTIPIGYADGISTTSGKWHCYVLIKKTSSNLVCSLHGEAEVPKRTKTPDNFLVNGICNHKQPK